MQIAGRSAAARFSTAVRPARRWVSRKLLDQPDDVHERRWPRRRASTVISAVEMTSAGGSDGAAPITSDGGDAAAAQAEPAWVGQVDAYRAGVRTRSMQQGQPAVRSPA